MNSAIAKNDPVRIYSCLIYGISTIGIYFISTVYHWSREPHKEFFRTLDYVGIYLKIAGNYTPYAILAIGGMKGWAIMVAVWSLALTGIIQEVTLRSKKRKCSNVIYFLMSASVLPVIHQLYSAVPILGFGLIMLGFLSYFIGFFVWLNDHRIPHGHGIWHLLVIGGSTCQFLTLWLFVV